MRANSRNSIRWSVATAVVALAIGALPLTFNDDGDAITGNAALAGEGGNGRLVAANSQALLDADAVIDEEKEQSASGLADDANENQATGTGQGLGNGDDGDRVGDDSDVASVDASANDGDPVDGAADSVATAAEDATDAVGEFFDDTF